MKRTKVFAGWRPRCSRTFSLVLHAGDLTRIGVVEAFEEKRLIAVRGNMDRGKAAASLPQKRIVTVAGRRIGLIHGGGSPLGIEKRVEKEKDLQKLTTATHGK